MTINGKPVYIKLRYFALPTLRRHYRWRRWLVPAWYRWLLWD